MIKYLAAIFFVINSLSSIALAWKEVGNAAGVSEQNIIYAKENSEQLLSRVGQTLTSELDRNLLKEFTSELQKSSLEFNYETGRSEAFVLQGDTWILFSQNLLTYDVDQNGYLSLTEAYRLLLEIFAYKKGYQTERSPFVVFEKNVLQILGAEEKTLILKTYGEELQWSELSGVYYVFYENMKPLQLSEAILQARLCPGQILNMRLLNPSLTSAQRQDTEVRFLVTVDSSFQCDGQMIFKKLMMDLRANLTEATLVLH